MGSVRPGLMMTDPRAGALGLNRPARSCAPSAAESQ